MSFTNSRGVPECRHVFPNGKRCHAPALRGKPLCYFHSRNKSVINENRNRASSVALPPLEDHGSIQIAVNEVLAAHAAGKIDRKGIWPYLVGIQIASRNLANAKGNVVSPEPVEDCEEQFGESLAPPAEGEPEVKIESPSSLCLDRVEACAGYTCATHEYDPEPLPLLPESRQVKPSRWGAFSSRIQLNRFHDSSDAWLKGFHAGRSGSSIPNHPTTAPEEHLQFEKVSADIFHEADSQTSTKLGAPGPSPLETGMGVSDPSPLETELGAPGPSPLETELGVSDPSPLETELGAPGASPLGTRETATPNQSCPCATEVGAPSNAQPHRALGGKPQNSIGPIPRSPQNLGAPEPCRKIEAKPSKQRIIFSKGRLPRRRTAAAAPSP